jgi:hypothetical protein
MSDSILKGLGRGFTRHVDNVPGAGDPGHSEAMKQISNEIVNSDTLMTYLTATNFGHDVVKVSVLYSIARYSAGFGWQQCIARPHARSARRNEGGSITYVGEI